MYILLDNEDNISHVLCVDLGVEVRHNVICVYKKIRQEGLCSISSEQDPINKSEFYKDLGGIQKRNLYWDSKHVGTSKYQRAPGVSRANKEWEVRRNNRQAAFMQ